MRERPLDASVEVANYSEREEKIKILLKGNGAELAHREVLVGSGKTAAVAFEAIADHPSYEAEIANPDVLPVDNRRFAVAPASRNLRILGITPRPRELESLKAIPGVQIDIIAPADYTLLSTPATFGDLYICPPAALPSVAALFILPPESSTVVDLGRPATPPSPTCATLFADPLGEFHLFGAYARPSAQTPRLLSTARRQWHRQRRQGSLSHRRFAPSLLRPRQHADSVLLKSNHWFSHPRLARASHR